MILFLVLILLAMIVALPYYTEARRKVMDDSERSDAPGHFLQLSQGLTHVKWGGAVRGPVAVCVHGLTTPSFVWDSVTEGLGAMGYRVLTYDLYGRGYSDRPAGEQDAAFFLQQLEEVLAVEEITDEITLIGYSMGGSIATCYAAKHAPKIRHLVLIAPAGIQMTLDGLSRFIRDMPVLGDWLMMLLFPYKQRKETEAERALPCSVPDMADLQQRELNYRGFIAGVLSSLRGMLRQELEVEHREIHQAGLPVLAIWGQQDRIIPISAMGKLTTWSRMAREEMVEGAGHGLTYTHTDQVLDIMRERLREGLN
ncbi:alpha/beta hydrolase [Ruegeria sp. 2012CJ41-6]|uniref:Alpha/beta hydrolase n=1 Tax=Ruegeria spongiae TaxID=2942209 RepID=A0ABT0PYU4_9RHOB|nr:alpha/beta hydrolase [Ruegeria spongiae]MCL6282753.1 alpha/beta hydrolase [Ruegeria spongiae]